MTALNIFKKKKTEAKKTKKETKLSPVEAPEIKEKPKPEKAEKKEIKVQKGKRSDFAWRILKKPHITEQATNLAERNQYVFEVYPKANKVEIKKAIEDIYGVDVVSVKVINVPQKRRRLGRIQGWRAGYKKAIARVKAGQKIEVMPR